MDETTQEQEIQGSDPLAFPLSLGQRLICGVFIVVIPIINFSLIDIMKPDWQSGKFSDYIHLFLLPEASFVFFPLLAYSVISYIFLLVSPTRYASSFLVRMGIYTGVILSFQYSILALLALGFSPLVLAIDILPLVLSRLYPWVVRKWGARFTGLFFAIVVIVLYIICSLITQDFEFFLTLLLLCPAIGAPFWSFLLALQAATWLVKNFETKVTFVRGFGFTAWLAAYIAAWRFDVLKMYELYAALPPQPPDCYVATAAAKGHPRLVRSSVIELENGKRLCINQQLQRLKCFELALMVLSPSLHGFVRRIYDVVGQKMAALIRNPYLADVAYLTLVPVEWALFLFLKLLVPEAGTISRRIYFQ